MKITKDASTFNHFMSKKVQICT